MIRQSYSTDEELKSYEVYGIEKTEVIPSEYGDHKYVTFGRGLVVGYGDTYLGDGDSVWYVRIWNPVTKKEDHIGKGYVNAAPWKDDAVEYDATPEVKADWETWKAEQQRIIDQKQRENDEADRKYRAEQELKTPRRGKVVRVVRGRKIPKGTEGRVFWYGRNNYGWGVGIELADGSKVFTNPNNVEVIAQADDGKEIVVHSDTVVLGA